MRTSVGGGRGNTVLVLFSFISGPDPRTTLCSRLSLRANARSGFMCWSDSVGIALRACVSQPRDPADDLRTLYLYTCV